MRSTYTFTEARIALPVTMDTRRTQDIFSGFRLLVTPHGSCVSQAELEKENKKKIHPLVLVHLFISGCDQNFEGFEDVFPQKFPQKFPQNFLGIYHTIKSST